MSDTTRFDCPQAAASQSLPRPAKRETRCRGRGVHIAEKIGASGPAYVMVAQNSQTDLLFAPCRGDIVVAPRILRPWLLRLRHVAGIIVESEDYMGPAASHARMLRIPLVIGIPNAGQFVPGETLTLLDDGRVLTVSSADVAPIVHRA